MALGVTIDIDAHIARFSQQLDRATQDMSSFAQSSKNSAETVRSVLTDLGVGLSVAGIAKTLKASIDLADNLKDLSKSTGLTVELLSGLSVAAQQSGADLESTAQAINKLSVNIGRDSDKFKQLGIDAKDPLEAFAQLADIFNAIDDPQKRAALGAAALGKSWANAAPLLIEGGAAIRKMVDDGSKASKITTEFAEQADILNDELEIMKARISGITNIVSGDFAIGLNKIIDLSKDAAKEISILANAFTGISSFKAGDLTDIDEKIAAQQRRLANYKKAFSIRSFFGNDALGEGNVNEENEKLKTLLDERAKIVDASQKKMAPTFKAPSNSAIDDFIKSGESSNKGKKLKADDGANEIANLERQLALFGEISEVVRVRYEIESGSLKNITSAQKERLLADAESLDAQKEYVDILTKGDELALSQRSNIRGIAEEAAKLKATLADFTPPPTNDFEARLYKIDDALQAGIFSAKEAKVEFDKLGQLQVAGNFDKQKEEIAGLSDFAVQASRNLQDSLASALSTGFQDGLDGMLKSFVGFLAESAAQAAASQLLELFAGKDSKSGILGAVFSGIGGLFSGARASGGPVSAGNTFLVGEKGPELFTPSNNGTILPNGSFGNTSSGVTVGNVNITVQQNSNDSPDQTGQKIAESFIRAIAKEEIKTANRPGNTLNKITSFG